MKSKIIFSLFILLIGIGLFNSFTSEKERKELLWNLKIAFMNNPNLPKIESQPWYGNVECTSLIPDPSAPQNKMLKRSPCQKILGREKVFVLHNIAWFRIGRIYTDQVWSNN